MKKKKNIFNYVREHLFPEETAYLVVDYVSKKYQDMGLADQLYKMLNEEITGFRFLIVICKFTEKRFIKLIRKHGYILQESFGQSGLFVKDLSK